MTTHETDIDIAFRTNYRDHNPFGMELLNRYAGNDPTSRWAVGEVQKIQAKIQQASNGHINLKRSLIKGEIEQDLKKLALEYKANTYNHFLDRMQQFQEKLSKRQKKSDTTRLADLMEAQIKYKAMTNDQINLMIGQLTETKNLTEKGLAFKTPIELDCLIAELRTRGENDIADQALKAVQDIPKQAIGDPESLEVLQEAHKYSSKPDPTSIYVFDERNSPIGVDLVTLIDLSPLERIPE